MRWERNASNGKEGNNLKKHRIKLIVVAAILCTFATLGATRLSIEPADYKKCVVKDLKTATQLLEDARPGNENGQYSESVILSFQDSVRNAQNLVDNKLSTVEEEKSAYYHLKDSVSTFKKSQNKDSISKKTVSSLKNDGKVLEKKIKLDKNTALTWKINGKAIDQPVAINPDVSRDTAHKEAIQKILQANQMKGTILSFRHNGDLPCFASISVGYSGASTDAYLYRYDGDGNKLVFSSRVAIDQKKEIFSIHQGGDWVIADKQLAVAGNLPSDGSAASASASSGSSAGGSSSSQAAGSGAGSAAGAASTVSGGKSAGSHGGSAAGAGGTGGATGGSGSDVSSGPGGGGSGGSTCTLEIRCDTILANMSHLKAGLASYVPSDGTIFPKTTISLRDGESVFDVLKRVTRNYKIQMEFRNDPTYSGAYIEGIHHLYEFDCGANSGWMYQVNGVFPSWGCSVIKVENGDHIVWVYTCDLGKDVGDQYYDTH